MWKNRPKYHVSLVAPLFRIWAVDAFWKFATSGQVLACVLFIFRNATTCIRTLTILTSTAVASLSCVSPADTCEYVQRLRAIVKAIVILCTAQFWICTIFWPMLPHITSTYTYVGECTRGFHFGSSPSWFKIQENRFWIHFDLVHQDEGCPFDLEQLWQK